MKKEADEAPGIGNKRWQGALVGSDEKNVCAKRGEIAQPGMKSRAVMEQAKSGIISGTAR